MSFIFIHIPRCGGFAVTKALRPFGESFSFDNHVPANQTINRVGRERFENSFTFSVVRNPFDRLVSLYRYICRDKSHHLHKIITKYKDFHEFVLSMPNQQNCLRDTQRSYLSEAISFVARFENIEEDFKIICDKLEVKASLTKKPEIPDYHNWYSGRNVEIVEEIFEEDLAVFEYEF